MRRSTKAGRRVTVVLGLSAALSLAASACSSGGDPAETTRSSPAASEDAASTDSGESPEPGTEAPGFDFDTAGLIDYLGDSFPDTGFSSEISLMFVAEELVLINLQTSFFDPDEAVALCQAVAGFIDAAGGPGTIEFVSTSGADVAFRATGGSACEAGADVS